MKNIVLLLVALAVVLGIAAAAPVTIDPNFELLQSGQSYDYANYGSWHAKAFEAPTGPSGANGVAGDYGFSKLTIDGAVLANPTTPGPVTSSFVSNDIRTLVFGDFIEGSNGEVQTARTGYFQGGSLYRLTKEGENAGWDPENDAIWDGDWSEKAGFTKDEYGWFSGKLGGVDTTSDLWYNDAQFMVIVPGTGSTPSALVDTSGATLNGANEDNTVLKIVTHTDRANQGATGNTELYEAYAGASQSGDIKIIPGSAPRVSGFGDWYGGFIDAWMPAGYENRIEFETTNEVAGEPYGMTSGTNGPRPEWTWWTS
jgi:hypothetical protein